MSKELSNKEKIRKLQRQAEKMYSELAELAGDDDTKEKGVDVQERIDAIEEKLDKLIKAVSEDDDD